MITTRGIFGTNSAYHLHYNPNSTTSYGTIPNITTTSKIQDPEYPARRMAEDDLQTHR